MDADEVIAQIETDKVHQDHLAELMTILALCKYKALGSFDEVVHLA